MCPKWGHIICQWHSGAAQGDDQVRSRKGARDSVAVLKSALRIPKASMASVEVINLKALATGEGDGTRQSNVVIMYYLFLFIVYYLRPARGPKRRMSPGNFTDLSLINFRKLFAFPLPLSVCVCLPFSTLSQWASGQWASREAASGNSSISLIIKLSIIYINLLLCGRNFNGALLLLQLSLSLFLSITDLSHNAHYHDDVVLISSVPLLPSRSLPLLPAWPGPSLISCCGERGEARLGLFVCH